MNRLVILGMGDHGRQVVELVRVLQAASPPPPWILAGFLDAGVPGRHVDGVPVLGSEEALAEIPGGWDLTHFVVGIGSTGATECRGRAFQKALASGLLPVRALIHPTARVAPSVILGLGSVVLAGAILQRNCVVGDNVLVNTGAQADHDCAIGAHTHLAPGAILCGAVRLGAGVHVGAGAVVREYCTVGDEAVIGMGAVVLRDVPAGATVVGNPARLLRKG